MEKQIVTNAKPTAPHSPKVKVRMESLTQIRRIILTLLMSGFALLMIMPFIWMISTSFKSPADVFTYPIQWIPSSLNWEHHIKVWSGADTFATYYLNSLKISLISTVGAVFLSAFAAYGFCTDSIQRSGDTVPDLSLDDDGASAGTLCTEVPDV
ncbi:hypothetical protein Q0F98_32605 [Paenibacillus amylolyticus]|nr:hypothetical protein Q0F98_32605 [Paenibacillus amylolyticus]